MKREIDFVIKVLFVLLLSLISILVIFTKPNISLKGKEVMEINYNSEFKEPGYIATFIVKNVTKKVKVNGVVDTTKLGEYKIEYDLSISGFKNHKTRIVKVVDKKKPFIELSGNGNTCPGKSYIEEGYKAVDEIDGDLTDKVKVEYKDSKGIYTVSDKAKNTFSISRDLVIKDETKPTITLNGGDSIVVYTGSSYNEQGVTIQDNCTDNIEAKIEGSVDANKVGKYEIKYTATDASGNTSEVIRTVNVINRPSSSSQIDGHGKIIYLTFDDGPGPYTEKILNILDKYGVKATFFVTNKPSYNYLIGEEYRRGHKIGVHANQHTYSVVYASLEAYINDFNAMNEIIKQQTGSYTDIYRFPGGSSNTAHCHYSPRIISVIASTLANQGYQYFDWNLSSGDAGGAPTSYAIYSNVINGAGRADETIVLMHDINGLTANALDSMIANLQSRGFIFKTLNRNSYAAHHSFSSCSRY